MAFFSTGQRRLVASPALTLSLLSLLFVVLQILVAIGNDPLPLKSIQFQAFLNPAVLFTGEIGRDIVWFICAHICVYAVFTGYLIWLTHQLSKQWQFSETQRFKCGLALWSFAVLLILLANQYYFPRSQFAFWYVDLSAATTTPLWLKALATALYSGVGIFLILTVIALVQTMGRQIARKNHFVPLTLMLCMAAVLVLFGSAQQSEQIAQKAKTFPNVILIGLDSVRPDHINEDNTPYLHAFLNTALQFEPAFTPLARTFPAWITLISAKHPKNHGARFNLAAPEVMSLDHNLVNHFNMLGYHSIFATDERRFSNIDQDYGFDQIIGPKMGFNDFLLGKLNDFPLSNLLINTELGRFLFPYSHANRAVSFAYQPGTFIKLLKKKMPEDTDTPIFTAIHLCLSHWPYYTGEKLSVGFNSLKSPWSERYKTSLKNIDAQFKETMMLLRNKKLLDDAIVVVFSDHGEALGVLGERLTQLDKYRGKSKPLDNTFYNFFSSIAYSHGTDVLSVPQHKIVLSFKRFGSESWAQGTSAQPAMLYDIMPTLFSAINETIPAHDGLDLMPWIQQGPTPELLVRNFYFENGFKPMVIENVDKNLNDMIIRSLFYYEVDKRRNSIRIKPEMTPLIVSHKQRAIVQYPWYLSVYPTEDETAQVLLARLDTGEWTDVLDNSFAKQAPVQALAHALYDFYEDELPPYLRHPLNAIK